MLIESGIILHSLTGSHVHLLTTIRQALFLMGREQRKRWLLLLVLAIVTSLVEIVGAALVYVLLSLVANPGGAIELPIIGDIRKLGGNTSDRTLLLTLIGVMIAFFLFRAAISLMTQYVTARVTNNAAARLSTKLIKGYLTMPYSFHLQHNSSEFIRNGHQAPLEIVGSVFNPLIGMAAEAVLTIGILVLLVVVSPIGTALAVAVIGGSAAILMAVIQPRLKRLGRTAWGIQKETLASLQQSLQGVRDIKVLGRETFFSNAYGHARWRLSRMMYLSTTLKQTPRLVIETSLVGFILVLFAVTVATTSEPREALSTLGLFAYAGLRIQPSLQKIIAGFNSLKYSTAPTADLHRDLQMIEQFSAERHAAGPFPFEREISLEGVSFAYEGNAFDALAEVDLAVRRGEQIGICGPTGGGKTTLVDLMAGLLSPTTGRVLVDGQDIATNIRGWQRNLGMVPQMVFLFDDTLRRNIALGVADTDIDEAAVAEAVQSAQLDEFVASLPQGLDTVVGERGIRLSGGERQRIAIARSLYTRPQVLILDEGTSALDNTTEQDLMRALKHLRGTRTILLVAHRLSTVRDADRVIFIENGRVAGIDTFEGLCRCNESFRQMAGVGVG